VTIELTKRHWILFSALAVAQFAGLWMSLARLPYGPAVLEFFTRGGWFGLVIPFSWVVGSAFMTTVIITELLRRVLAKRE